MLAHEAFRKTFFNDSALEQCFHPKLPHRRVTRNLPVHRGLGKARLVAFVVTVAAVADQVDHEVLVKANAIGERQARRLDRGLRMIGVHVHDRNPEAPRQIARVDRAPAILGRAGEPELVVGDDVNRAPGVIARQAKEIQRLSYDALAREGRIAMDQEGQRPRGIEARRPRPVHLSSGSARHALDHGVHGFEVTRVGRQRHHEAHGLALLHRMPCARVILHVARPAQITTVSTGLHRVFELSQDLGIGLV